MRVLVTGDRHWTDGQGIRYILQQVPNLYKRSVEDLTLVHGAARGADTLAAYHATLLGWRIDPFPADWNAHGRSAGPIRNRAMLDSGVDICFAFHDKIAESRGTKNMIEQCIKKEVVTALYSHDSNRNLFLANLWCVSWNRITEYADFNA